MPQKQTKILASVAFLGLGVLCLCPVGNAQQQNTQDDLSRQISALKSEVDTIKNEQEQIIDKLNELEHVLKASSGSAPQAPATLEIRGEPIRGRDSARVVLLAYADFECPFCEQYMTDVFPKLLNDYINPGIVKYVFRDFPLSIHPDAAPAARGAHCAADQGRYWEMHDKLFANQAALGQSDLERYAHDLGLDANAFHRCLASNKYANTIRASIAEAEAMGVDGTPTFFLGTVDSNGEMTVKKSIVGDYPYAVFKTDIDELLHQKN